MYTNVYNYIYMLVAVMVVANEVLWIVVETECGQDLQATNLHSTLHILLFCSDFLKFPSSKPDPLILPSFSSKRCTIDIVNSISGWRLTGIPNNFCEVWYRQQVADDEATNWLQWCRVYNWLILSSHLLKHYPWFRDVIFSQWELKCKFYIKLITLTASQTIHSIATIS